jgi:hypothetical protein
MAMNLTPVITHNHFVHLAKYVWWGGRVWTHFSVWGDRSARELQNRGLRTLRLDQGSTVRMYDHHSGTCPGHCKRVGRITEVKAFSEQGGRSAVTSATRFFLYHRLPERLMLFIFWEWALSHRLT